MRGVMTEYSTVDQTSNFLIYLIFLVGAFVVFAIIYLLLKKLNKKNMSERADDLVILEVRVPKKFEKEEYESLKSIANISAVADQFFSSLSATQVDGIKGLFVQPIISFEYVSKDNEIIFFVGVPKAYRSLIEKQIQSYYPNSNIEPSGDFRIFKEGQHAAYGMITTGRSFIYPIKTYEELESDSISSITNTLSKIGEDSRASVQILLKPTNQGWRGDVDWVLRRIQEGKGVPLGVSWYNKVSFYLSQLAFSSFNSKENEPMSRSTPIQEEAQKLLTKKSGKTGFHVEIRIVCLGNTEAEAQTNLKNIASSFGQFSAPDRNTLKLIKNFNKNKFMTHFVLRTFYSRPKIILNTEEIATLYHFPSEHIDTPGIRWFLAKRSPAPPNMPKEGLTLGKNIYRGMETIIKLQNDDRRRHLYTIGMTGTGKSTFFESMILQDIKAGKGLAVFDPHGELVEEILKKVPKERAEDIIYFDPSDTSRPMGVNLLEWKTKEQKDFLVQEAIQIFYKLFDPNGQGFVGPQFEHWMRNAALTLMEYPGGGTLIEVPKLFTDDGFREERVKHVKDNVVKAFWTEQLAKTSDFHKSEMYNYFISKFGRFMTNHTIRNIIGQTQSAFDFREIMDKEKVILINLSKGNIGEINSNLLGMIFVAKLFTASLSRVDMEQDQRKDFYLYVDEFQNFATDTFAAILSEARKFRLNLCITNQYIAQIPENIRDAIVGNVGTMIAFRIGVPDAEFMAKEFEPVANQFDLNQIDAFNAYIKMLINNAPTKPFSMQTIKDPSEKNDEIGNAVRELSRLKYGKDVAIVDMEIGERTKVVEVPDDKNNIAREAKM